LAREPVAVTLRLRAPSGFWVQESGCLSAAPGGVRLVVRLVGMGQEEHTVDDY
jgi:hypothetical protein